METYVSFRYPELEKSLNGGPVPSIVTDVVILHQDNPHGLQVIEEILGEEEALDTTELKNELAQLSVNLLKLQKSWKQFPLKVWEIFDANHQSISRMMSVLSARAVLIASAEVPYQCPKTSAYSTKACCAVIARNSESDTKW